MQGEHAAHCDSHWAFSSASTASLPVQGFAASGSQGCEPVLAQHAQSLGTSALSFERAMKMAAVVIAFGTTVTFDNDASVAHALAPTDLEVAVAPHAAATARDTGAVSGRACARSIDALFAAVDEETVEDGVTHRAEALLAAHVQQFGSDQLAQHIVSTTPAARSASLLRLLGRAAGVNGAARRFVVERGLASDSVEVRDAAVQAVESWEDASLASLLRERNEPVAWLASYAQRVAAELEG